MATLAGYIIHRLTETVYRIYRWTPCHTAEDVQGSGLMPGSMVKLLYRRISPVRPSLINADQGIRQHPGSQECSYLLASFFLLGSSVKDVCEYFRSECKGKDRSAVSPETEEERPPI